MASVHTDQERASMEGPRDLKEQGSVPWAWQTVSALQHMWQSLHLNYEHYMKILTEAREQRIWEKIPPGNPFGSEDNMLAHVEVGDAKDAQKRMKIQTLAATAQQLRAYGGDRRSKEFQASHAKLETIKAGANDQYLLGRILRDHPDVYKRIEQGEFASVAEAARAAGIVNKRRKVVSLSDNVGRLAETIHGHYTPEQITEFTKRVLDLRRQRRPSR